MNFENFNDTIAQKIILNKKLLKLSDSIIFSAKKIFKTIKNGGKIFICGNGGSAADAQHLSAEFLIRLRPNVNRKPYPVISLAQDVSTITACGNDLGFEKIFERNLMALGSKKDLLLVISTSGNSKNIINVLKYAKKKKNFLIGFSR